MSDGMNPKDAAALTRAPLHLLPAVTSIYGSMACRQGAIDYGPYNWREKPISLMKYLGALERHIARLKDGEWIDKKSGCPHLGHIIATSGILLDAQECGMLIDDRPLKPGRATEILDEIEEVLRNGSCGTTEGDAGTAPAGEESSAGTVETGSIFVSPVYGAGGEESEPLVQVTRLEGEGSEPHS